MPATPEVESALARVQQQLADLKARIAELHRGRQTMLESEARLRIAMEAARFRVWEWDIASDEIRYTAAGFLMIPALANPNQPVRFDDFLSAAHPEDRPLIVRARDDALAGLRPYEVQFRIPWPDGSLRWSEARGEIMRDAAGNPVRLVGISIDITERKEVEEALSRHADRLTAVCRTQQTIISAAHDQHAVMTTIAERAVQLTHAAGALVGVLEGNSLLCKAATGVVRGYLGYKLGLKRSLAGLCVRRGHVLSSRDAAHDPHVDRKAARTAGVRSIIAVPLQHEGATIGALEVVSPDPWAFGPDDAETLQLLAGFLATAMKLASDFEDRQRLVTERTAALDSLRESEERFHRFMDHSPIGAFIKDRDGRYVYANRTFTRYVNRPLEELLKLEDADLFSPETAACIRADDLGVITTGKTLEKSLTLVDREGNVRDRLVYKFLIRDTCNRLFVGGAVLDLTEQKQLERAVLEISEREQERIGRDLHDGLGQLLTGLRYHANVLHERLQQDGHAAAEDAEHISTLLGETIHLAHRLARGLHPVKADPHGLMAALEDLAVTTKRMFRIACVYRCRAPVLVHDAAVATHLYRIAQEAVHNAVKHGGAKRITISLSFSRLELTLRITNDGVPFTAPQPGQGGLGLGTMRYRSNVIGAGLDIRPGKRGGTRLTCRVPHAGARLESPLSP